MAVTRIQTVYVVADQVLQVADFYQALFGTEPRFRDGEKWVQFSVGGAGFAVASRGEAAEDSIGAITVFQSDDAADHARIVAAGAVPFARRDMGDHGWTRTFRDPGGNVFQVIWRP